MSQIASTFITLFLFFHLLHIGGALAQTAQQIEQFKRLPKAQQEQLARQMGIDLSQLSSLRVDTSEPEEDDTVYPRGTNFDEYGNPIEVLQEPEYLQAKEELTLYGRDLFANAPSSFTSVANLPIPDEYVIGPGDELAIQIFGKENEEHILRVGRDGKVVIPKLGPVSVSSKTFSELKTYLVEKVKQQIIGVDVSIRLSELRSMRIFVLGEAFKPGAYNVSSLSTVTHALFASGGVSDIASLRNIQLKRQGQVITTLDLYDLLNHGDTRNDLPLRAGDVVFIPSVSKTIKVDGLVRRPAIYEIKGNEALEDVLELAGGVLANGYEKAISIKRFVDGRQIQLTVDKLNDKIEVLNGDEIVVPEVSKFVGDSITVIGAVARPGKYQWKEKLSVFSLLGDSQRELLETADLSYVLVLREDSKTHELDVLQVDLTLNDSDVLLQRNDKVLVFSVLESQELGDIQLEQLAFTETKLKEKEEQQWQQRIKEKLFWRSVGLEKGLDDSSPIAGEVNDLQGQSIIELTEAEREKVLEFKDSTYFSRKRMLAPVILLLREQAKYGKPLKLVEVAGEVKVPGIYPLSKNASVKELIKAAGGLTEASYPEKSEITRTEINEDGVAVVRHIEFKPFDALKNNGGSSGDIAVQSKDRINIFSIPSWQEELTVTVKGEVEFPGEYTIKRGETLRDLLRRVGGLTKFGDPESVIFTREMLKEQERKNLRALAEELRKQIASESLRRQAGAGSIVSYDEARKLLRDLTKTEAIGRLVIDLPHLLSNNYSIDVILEDGDKLYVPVRSQSVNVIGEVYVPTSHLYVEEQPYESYIEKSGGFRPLADTNRAYIIRANGSVVLPDGGSGFWFGGSTTNNVIKPGDTIVIPFDSNNVDNMTLWANATQIIYQLAVAVAAIGSL